MSRHFDDRERRDTPTDSYDEDEELQSDEDDGGGWKKSVWRRISAEGWFGVLLGITGALMIFFFSVPFLLDWLTPAPTRATSSLEASPPSAPSSVAPRPMRVASNLPAQASEAPRRSVLRTPPATSGQFWVQVGAFKQAKNAVRLASQLKAQHYPAVVRQQQAAAPGHLVWVGSYPDRTRAEATKDSLQRKGFGGFILKRERR